MSDSKSEEARRARGAGVVVTARVSQDAVARLDAEARRRGLSRSALIEALAAELPEAEAD